MTEDPRPAGSPPPEPVGIGGLLEGLFAGLAQLFRHELALARLEARQSILRLKSGLILVAVALVLALVALNVAATTATAALVAAGVGAVLSPALVTLATLALAVLCLWLAARHLSARSLAPRRTIAALRRNGETLVNMVKPDA